MSLTKVPNRMIADAFVNVRDFGASSSASAAANLAAFNAAVTATPVGGTLYVPADGGEYVIDTTGGKSSAVLINKRMTVFIDGDVKANYSAIEANAPTIFNVTANHVTFLGSGQVIGDGTVDQQNIGGELPSLIYVTGSYFTMSEITIVTAPKVGLYLASGTNAKITNCNFTGGATQYEDTAYFAIRIDSGAYHIVSNNQFFPDASGGMYVNCIFAIASHCIYDSNVCHKPFEKLFYITGDNNIISNNTVIGNSGTVAGTNNEGNIGSAIRCDGGYNKITGNFTQYTSGIGARFEGGNSIADNIIIDSGQGGIAVFQGTSVLDFTTITNNTVTCGNLAGAIIQDGILVNCATGTNYQINVSGNVVKGFAPVDRHQNLPSWQASQVITDSLLYPIRPTTPNNFYYTPQNAGTTGGVEPVFPTSAGATVVDGTVTWVAVAYGTSNIANIRVSAPSQKAVYCQVSNNILNDSTIGIQTDYMSESVISNNFIVASSYPIIQTNGTKNKYRFNVFKGATNKGIGSMDGTSYGEGNTYDDADVCVNVTLTAGVSSQTISTTLLIAATSGVKFLISPQNDAAADYIRDHGLFCTNSGATVSINSASGTNFVGTEIVTVQLIQ